MKSAFPILAAAAALLLAAGSAQAARPMGGNSNIILPPAPPLQSSLPPMTNSGALNTPQPLGTPPVNTGALGITGPAPPAFLASKASARFPAIRDRLATTRMLPCPVWAILDRQCLPMRGHQPQASML